MPRLTLDQSFYPSDGVKMQKAVFEKECGYEFSINDPSSQICRSLVRRSRGGEPFDVRDACRCPGVGGG